ncbi:MAG: hypothetical protein ABI867_09145 [Kofleriaceae bacterium]
MISLLISLALLFGAHVGSCESAEPTPMQVECVAVDAIVEIVAPERPATADVARAHHREASRRPSPQLARVFRPPRS